MLIVPIPWAKTLDQPGIVTKGKGFREDKEENKDLSVAPESRIQEPREEDGVKPTKNILVHATNALELEDC